MGMIVTHQDLLLRVNTQKNCIEYSKNDGKTWSKQGSVGSNGGDILDLLDNGSELLATTTKGLYYSKNQGKTFSKK